MTHPSDQIWAEVVRIGRNLHWPLDSVLDLEHGARARVLREIDALGSVPPAVR